MFGKSAATGNFQKILWDSESQILSNIARNRHISQHSFICVQASVLALVILKIYCPVNLSNVIFYPNLKKKMLTLSICLLKIVHQLINCFSSFTGFIPNEMHLLVVSPKWPINQIFCPSPMVFPYPQNGRIIFPNWLTVDKIQWLLLKVFFRMHHRDKIFSYYNIWYLDLWYMQKNYNSQ